MASANSNRRQPTRSVRTATNRPSNYYARPFGARGVAPNAGDHEKRTPSPPGFFPAITHFTDSIAALPKEIIRHLTMLRESDGKAYAPDLAINELVEAIKSVPDPPLQQAYVPTHAYLGLSAVNSTVASVAGSVFDGHASVHRDQKTKDGPRIVNPIDEYAETRQRLQVQLQEKIREILGVLEEKTMVYHATNETLSRQLTRVDSSLPYIEKEISEEARLGSNTHWALPHMKELRRGTLGGTTDRSRREIQATNNLAAAAAAVHESEITATRSEARREAMLAKRGRYGNVDSDFDERAPRKQVTTGKARKTADTLPPNKANANGNGSQPHKRRRVDKPAGTAMERSMSAAVNGRLANKKETSRASPAPEANRRRAKPLPNQALSRKKNNVASPSITSSPTRGVFAPPAPRKDASPAPSTQRSAASRARQNSTQSLLQDTLRNRPSPSATNIRHMEGIGSDAPLERSQGHTVLPQAGSHDALGISNAGYVDGTDGESQGRTWATESNPQQLKREETEPAEGEDHAAVAPQPFAPQLIQTHGRSRGGSRSSKPTTPLDAALPDGSSQSMAKSRSTRGNGTAASPTMSGLSAQNTSGLPSPRRSHKKGAGNSRPNTGNVSSAFSPAKAPSRPMSTSPSSEQHPVAPESTANGNHSRSRQRAKGVQDIAAEERDGTDGEQEEIDEDDEDEPRYCTCGRVSFGDMIACDNPSCPHEWFHWPCVGLTKSPNPSSNWYCSDSCRRMGPGAN
ncbi:MAG: hypothetical protein M1828_002421 [Chrysothrix sp. TS-e1954]|nr:MAG: hypothetical protein M1828_002421 [Chrysothrix sp. TS-e1954]